VEINALTTLLKSKLQKKSLVLALVEITMQKNLKFLRPNKNSSTLKWTIR